MKKLILAAVLPLFILAAGQRAFADQCEPFKQAVLPDGKSAAYVPEELLSNRQVATICLVKVLKEIGKEAKSVRDVEWYENEAKLMSSTAALRSIALSTEAGNSDYAIDKFISDFRSADDVDVISALTLATRSNNRDLRLNSVLILGNVIDNTTVCVPLTNLNDIGLLSEPAGISGRANLLGVVSVVAPWAYSENYKAIEATTNYWEAATKSESDVEQTRKILENIKIRLDTKANWDVPLQKLGDNGKSKADCEEYAARYAKSSLPEWNMISPYQTNLAPTPQ